MENIKEEIMEMKIHGSNMKKKKLLKIMENLKSEYSKAQACCREK